MNAFVVGAASTRRHLMLLIGLASTALHNRTRRRVPHPASPEIIHILGILQCDAVPPVPATQYVSQREIQFACMDLPSRARRPGRRHSTVRCTSGSNRRQHSTARHVQRLITLDLVRRLGRPGFGAGKKQVRLSGLLQGPVQVVEAVSGVRYGRLLRAKFKGEF